MQIGIIYARSRNGVIGKDGTMPWRLPEDMAHFKQVTMGHPVIMGRKTWDSIPAKFRPLPGRRNIVVTRNADWSAEGAERAGSLDEAFALCAGADEVWVAGGAQIYGQAMSRAHVAEVTVIDQDFEGDAYAPELGGQWHEEAREAHTAAQGLSFAFIRLRNTGLA
jgi:dihydrofolate reductase